MRYVCKTLIGKTEGKRPHARPRRKLEDIIRIYLREIGCEGADCTHVAEDRDQWRALVNRIMDVRVPKKKKKGGEFLDYLSDY
jgi:hypothetical protein